MTPELADHLPLIGRDALLTRLRAALTPPYAGAAAVLLEGPAGIGKTSLLRVALADAEAAGVTVLLAHPVEAEATFAYNTLADLFGQHLAALETSLAPAHREALSIALDLGESLSPGAGAAVAPDAQRVAMAVLAACRALAASRPLLIAIDDAPWVDQSSADALGFALRRMAELPVRLLMAARSDAPGAAVPFGLADAARPMVVQRQWIEPLSMGAIHQLVREATGASFTRPTLLRIRGLSDGNPFYALELARAVAADGSILRPDRALPVPSSLRGLLDARLGRLPVPTRRLLLTAALSARPTASLLEAFAGADVHDVLRPALDAGLVRLDGPALVFSHPLYASTLVAEAQPADIRATHAWLGEAASEDPEARARHLAMASDGPDARVATALARAAARARQRGAPSVAGELADLAVQRTPPNSPELSERTLDAAEAWLSAGDLPAAQRRAAAFLPAAHGTQRARVLMLIGIVTWYTGSARDTAAVLKSALADAEADPALQGLLEFYLGIFTDFDIQAAYQHALAAARLLEHTADRGRYGAALLQAFHWAVALGRRPPLSLLARGLEVEAEGPLTDRVTTPGMWWAAIGRLEQARGHFQQLLDFDLIHGEYSNAANLLTRLAEVELWADDWPAARHHAEAAAEAGIETAGEPSEMARRALALVDAHEGRLDAAEVAAVEGVRRMERQGSAALIAAWLQVAAIAAASRGNAERVEEATALAWHHLHAVGYAEPMRLDPAPERIEALAVLGRLDEASAELVGLEERQRRVAKPWAAAAIVRGQARIALAHHDPAGALAVTALVASGGPPDWSRFDLARTLLIRGEALRQTRSRRAAAEILQRAEAIFHDLGAAVWAQRATGERSRLGLSWSAGLALTPTEERVARLAGEGLSTRDVAAQLGTSPRTVESHLGSIYGKLGVSSRAELGRRMALREEG